MKGVAVFHSQADRVHSIKKKSFSLFLLKAYHFVYQQHTKTNTGTYNTQHMSSFCTKQFVNVSYYVSYHPKM